MSEYAAHLINYVWPILILTLLHPHGNNEWQEMGNVSDQLQQPEWHSQKRSCERNDQSVCTCLTKSCHMHNDELCMNTHRPDKIQLINVQVVELHKLNTQLKHKYFHPSIILYINRFSSQEPRECWSLPLLSFGERWDIPWTCHQSITGLTYRNR